MALFTAIKKFPDKYYNDNEPIEMELVPDEIFYKDMSNFEVQKNIKKNNVRKNQLLIKKAVLENLLQNKITTRDEIDNILGKSNITDVAYVISNKFTIVTPAITPIKTEKANEEYLKNIATNFTNKKFYHQWDEIIKNGFEVKLEDTQLPDLTLEQARLISDKLQNLEVDHSWQHISELDTRKIYEHYQYLIEELNSELEYLSETILLLERIPISTKLLATPNDLRIASIGTKQPLKWIDVDEKHKEKVKEILKSTAPEILQKLEDDDNPNEIISHFIGIKLTKIELRILKTLRAIVDHTVKVGEVQSHSQKVRIIRSNFYKEYGLKPKLNGGYEDNQTKKIREVLFSGNSNLTKRMFFNNSKNKTVLVTAFVLKIEWEEEKNNYFEVMLDDIIFVKDQSKEYSYYYEDLQGLNRLLALMPNSDSAFNLHYYFEYSLKSNTQSFNCNTLLKESGLINSYNNKNPKRAITSLEKILNNMVKAKTLILSWKKEQSNSDIEGSKYILTNIRQIENDIKKQTTKKRKYKSKNN